MSSETLVLYGNEEVRTTVIDKQMWWMLVDVCKVIGIKNNHDVAKKLDEDEKAEVDTMLPGWMEPRKEECLPASPFP